MNATVKSLLKDKNVLRIVVFISIVNLLGYVMMRDVDNVAYFVLIGFLTSYFSKNMIIVLLVAMLLTNFIAVINKTNSTEGFGGKGSGRKHSKRVQDSSLSVSPASNRVDQEMSIGAPGGLDDAATVEKAYENLENMLGTDAINKMSSDTKKLSDRQKNLQKQIETLQPVLKNSFQLLGQMGGAKGVEGMINKVGGMLEKFGGITNSIMNKK